MIARGKKPTIRLVLAPRPTPRGKRVLGKYAGQCTYSDNIFKPLETDEELREYGLDILADAKVLGESAS